MVKIYEEMRFKEIGKNMSRHTEMKDLQSILLVSKTNQRIFPKFLFSTEPS